LDTKLVKFDFFTIDNIDVNDLVNKLDRALISKPVKHQGYFGRIESYTTDDSIRIGLAAKLRMDEVPYIASITEPGLHNINLKDDEGVANISSFIIAPEYRVLVLQRSYYGVRAGLMLHMLESLTGSSGIELNIMIDTKTLEKLNKMQVFSRFTFKVANPTNPNAYKNMPVKQAALLADHYQARNVKMELSMGSERKQFMSVDAVKESARSLLKLSKDNEVSLQNLVIRGKEFKDDNMSTLDLIQQRLVSEIKIPLTSRTLSKDDLERAVHQAYNAKIKDLANYKPL